MSGERRATAVKLTYCNGRANAVLTLLHAQVVQESMQHILRANGCGNVSKRVDSGTSDALLVRLQHFQQLEADTHPIRDYKTTWAREYEQKVNIEMKPVTENRTTEHHFVSSPVCSWNAYCIPLSR